MGLTSTAAKARVASPNASPLPRVRGYHCSCVPAKTCYRRATSSRTVREFSSRSAVALVTLLGAVGTGCGRRATEADCQLIVDKSVELGLRETNQTSPDAIEKREQQVRAELGDEMRSCEGRRVTDKTLACVRAAASTQELEKCLR